MAKKLHSAVTFGPRIAPRSIIVKCKWFQDYLSATTTGVTYKSATDNGNEGISLSNSGYYIRRFNLSSIYHPDVNATTAATTHSCYNWSEFCKYYTKWIVRACKMRMWIRATGTNGSDTSGFAPIQLCMWVNNVNDDASVTDIQTAMAQPGVRYYVIGENVYNAVPMKKIKGYWSTRKALKINVNEETDYGTMNVSGAGGDGRVDSNMYLHMLMRGGSPASTNSKINMGIQFTFYTKFWDAVSDAIDEVDPNV